MTAKKNIRKGLLLILVDFLGLVVGILNGFFLPAVFSIEGYALFRTFTLYASFATVFSFGISDGAYLLYGGKDESEIDRSKTKSYYYLLMKLQLVVLLLLLILSIYVLKDRAFLYFSLFVVPLQLIHFFRLYYRALGKFDRYSVFQGILVFLELINTILIVFYVGSGQPYLFITIKICNHILVAGFLTVVFLYRNKALRAVRLDRQQLLKLIRPGLMVIVADMLAVLLASIDRFIVKAYYNEEAFAYYSFAVSILTLFLTFITSITSIFYPYISRKVEDTSYMRKLKTYVLLISSSFLLAYYPIKLIIEMFIAKYSKALELLWILMLALPFIGMVNIVFINMYKASGRLRTYLIKMIIVILVSVGLNVAAVFIYDALTPVAVAALISFILWYLISSRDFRELLPGIREVLYMIVLFTGFILTQAYNNNIYISFGIFLLVWIMDVIIFYKKEVIEIFNITRLGNKLSD